jgi:hypothetical protein
MNEHREVKVNQTPDKSFHVMFGDADGITVGELAAALSALPPDKLLYDVCTTFHDPDDESGEGQSEAAIAARHAA